MKFCSILMAAVSVFGLRAGSVVGAVDGGYAVEHGRDAHATDGAVGVWHWALSKESWLFELPPPPAGETPASPFACLVEEQPGKDDHDDHSGKDAHDDHDDHSGHDHGHGHGGHSDEVKLTAEAIRRSGIRVGTVVKEAVVERVSVVGRVGFDLNHMAHLSTRVTGRVRELRAGVGSEVKVGDVLAIVESAELADAQSDYLAKREAAGNLAPLVELAKGSYERAQKMFDDSQSVSLTEVQGRLREYRTGQNELSAAKLAATAASRKLLLMGMDEAGVKALEESGKLSPLYEVKAPISGTVIEREITLGELVSPEKEAVFLIADLSKVWVVAEVPEARVGEVKVGASAEFVPMSGGEGAKGKVMFLGAELTGGSRTLPVRVEVENPERKLRVGMSGRVGIAIGDGKGEAVVVPEGAVTTWEGGSVVFAPVKGEEGTFAARPVKVGPSVGGKVAVLEGVKEGDEVVVGGAFVLKAELGKASAKHEH